MYRQVFVCPPTLQTGIEEHQDLKRPLHGKASYGNDTETCYILANIVVRHTITKTIR